jgi:hypothetical protein
VKCFDIRVPVKRGAEQIEIAVVCCLHFGHKAQDERRSMEWRDWILKSKNRFAINLGDDMENALPGDEVHNSMLWDSSMTPEEQYRRAAEYWKPVAEAGKLLITHDSNHAWRTEAKTGRSVAKELNVFLQGLTSKKPSTDPMPDQFPRWGRWQALSRLHVGKQTYTVHSWHGSGNGCTPEAALRKCRSQAEVHKADIFLMGHAHQKISWSDNYMEFSDNGRDARERQRMFAVTGGFLGWHDTYAERAGLRPNRRGAIALKLGVSEWDVKVGI